ncbi:MAG TPA: hypothetical protein VM553_20275 [Dongiaceae bacterium]|nr:hypothetical protein [Dongiaceae bacterium]
MDEYRHHVSGFFEKRNDADQALALLIKRGFPAEQLQVYTASTKAPPAPAPSQQSDEVLKDVVVDGAIGTAVGTGLGGLATIGLVAANVSLFIASPLIGPLTMLGWGAGLGALVGTAVGASTKSGEPKGHFADLVMDAIKSGNAVLVAETRSREQAAIAREVIRDAVGEYKDIAVS